MKPNNHSTSSCRYCRFYSPEGRRGGLCSQLNVSVKADWKSCQLAYPVFGDQWQKHSEIVILEKSFRIGCATPSKNLTTEVKNNQNDRDNLDHEEITFS